MTRNSPAAPLLELTLIGALFVGLYLFSGVAYAGPVAVIASVVAVTVLLSLRGETWASLGLKWPRSVGSALLGVGVAVLSVAAVAVAVIVLTPLVSEWVGPPRASSVLGNLDTLEQYILIMIIAWTSAAIGEELLFRGFVLTRLSQMFGGSGLAWGLAVVGQAVLFGLAHYGQGPFGIVMTGVIGLVFGLICLATRRNLLPLILAHGLVDTIALSQAYFR